MRSVSVYFLSLLLACNLAQAEAPPIQQWIDEAIQAGGGVVTIPEGEHVLEKGLVIKDAKKLAIRGVDKERCILKLAASTQDSALIQITGTCETLEIAGLTLVTGLPESYKVPAKTDELAASIKDVTLRDCLLQNFPGSAISIQHATAVSIERCSFRDGTGAAMRWENAQSCIAQGNQIIRVATAFDLQSGHACLLEGNEVRDSQVAMLISSPRPQPPEARHTLRNNSFYNVAEGLDISTVQPAPLSEKNDGLDAR